ncbi:MAG: hypothetical protein WC368_01740 [Candidatus Cloacimonadaceae bacterium]
MLFGRFWTLQYHDSVHEEIYGNGNSNNSLVTRMARVETNMKLQ